MRNVELSLPRPPPTLELLNSVWRGCKLVVNVDQLIHENTDSFKLEEEPRLISFKQSVLRCRHTVRMINAASEFVSDLGESKLNHVRVCLY